LVASENVFELPICRLCLQKSGHLAKASECPAFNIDWIGVERREVFLYVRVLIHHYEIVLDKLEILQSNDSHVVKRSDFLEIIQQAIQSSFFNGRVEMFPITESIVFDIIERLACFRVSDVLIENGDNEFGTLSNSSQAELPPI
jgi:hypothetical protein